MSRNPQHHHLAQQQQIIVDPLSAATTSIVSSSSLSPHNDNNTARTATGCLSPRGWVTTTTTGRDQSSSPSLIASSPNASPHATTTQSSNSNNTPPFPSSAAASAMILIPTSNNSSTPHTPVVTPTYRQQQQHRPASPRPPMSSSSSVIHYPTQASPGLTLQRSWDAATDALLQQQQQQQQSPPFHVSVQQYPFQLHPPPTAPPPPPQPRLLPRHRLAPRYQRPGSPSMGAALPQTNGWNSRPSSPSPPLAPPSGLFPTSSTSDRSVSSEVGVGYAYNTTTTMTTTNTTTTALAAGKTLSSSASPQRVSQRMPPHHHHHQALPPPPQQHNHRHHYHHRQYPSDRSVVSESFVSDHVRRAAASKRISSRGADQDNLSCCSTNGEENDDDDDEDDCSSVMTGASSVMSGRSHRTNPERRREIKRLAQNRMAKLQKRRQQQQQQSPLPHRHQHQQTVPSGIIDLLAEPRNKSMEDDVSTLGGVEDQSSAVLRMTLAIRNQSARPSSLTREERQLWDVIQTAIRKAKQYAAEKAKQQQQQHMMMESSGKDETTKESSMADQARSLRAIQRVLADVSVERDQALQELQTLKTTLADNKDHQLELVNKTAQIAVLEQSLKESANSKRALDEQQAAMSVELTALQKERDRLATDLAACRDELTKLSRSIIQSTESTGGDLNAIRKDLAEKTASLENAKMIIASLESANGSLAADMRAKLKAKEDEIIFLKKDASDRQKTLDSLATQLRDLQKTQSHTNRAKRKQEERRRLAISSRLEQNMAEMRAASVVLEVTNDASAAEKLSDILGDSINALKEGIDLVDDYTDDHGDIDSVASTNDNASYSSRNSHMPVDVMRLRRELDDRAKNISRLEDALRKEKENASQMLEEAERHRLEEVDSLRKEVQNLREQYQTNMEVLMRKERELATLRDSLKVDDGVGYISDDGTDASEAEDQRSMPSSAHLGISQYGPTQAEALATLLAHGRGHSDMIPCSPSQDEVETLKRDLRQARLESERSRKQLKTEKESLANAKMIISSLEKANKSMMEDLRSRLQDSNTAIASLLEKSMESEKTTYILRAELDALRREKEKEKERYEAELKKLGNVSLEHPCFEEKKEELMLISTTETID